MKDDTFTVALLLLHQEPWLHAAYLVHDLITKSPKEQIVFTLFTPIPPFLSFPVARRGGAAGAQGAAEGHARPTGGETAAAGGAETTGQGEGAGEGDMLPAADTQPG